MAMLPFWKFNFISGVGSILNFCNILARQIFISFIANRLPMHSRLPPPNGLNVKGMISDAFSFKNRSGLNVFGSEELGVVMRGPRGKPDPDSFLELDAVDFDVFRAEPEIVIGRPVQPEVLIERCIQVVQLRDCLVTDFAVT